MWMMGYTSQSSSSTTTSPADYNSTCGAVDQFGNPMSMTMSLSADHSLNGRRLCPLIPKPPSSTTIPTIPSCLTNGSCDNTNSYFFPLNHHMITTQSHPQLMGVREQGGRDQFNGHQSVMVSSRWNPTPEQLRALEELYRRGTRTPSAVQIQHITDQLRRYGKIEGKNVFYWFQNHKARERQKRRRQQLGDSSSTNDQQQSQDHHHEHQTKEPTLGKTTILNLSGEEGNHSENKGNKTVSEMGQTRHWVASTNCSKLADQESIHKLEKTAAECVTDDEWFHFQDHENSLQNASTIMFQDNAEEHRRRRTSLSLLAKNTTWDNTHHSTTNPCIKHTTTVNEACEYPCGQGSNKQAVEALTLELFPLRSNGETDSMKDNDLGDDDNGEKGTHLTSYQFFEFLPPKNSAAY